MVIRRCLPVTMLKATTSPRLALVSRMRLSIIISVKGKGWLKRRRRGTDWRPARAMGRRRTFGPGKKRWMSLAPSTGILCRPSSDRRSGRSASMVTRTQREMTMPPGRKTCRRRNIRDAKALWNIIMYVYGNPVKAGLVDRPEDWPWSSARDWAALAAGPILIGKESCLESWA